MAKRRDSPYRPGQRSRLWLKVKATLSDEFVVGGYTRGTGARAAPSARCSSASTTSRASCATPATSARASTTAC